MSLGEDGAPALADGEQRFGRYGITAVRHAAGGKIPPPVVFIRLRAGNADSFAGGRPVQERLSLLLAILDTRMPSDLHPSTVRSATRDEIPEIAALIAAALASLEGKAAAAVLKLYVQNSCDIGARWDEAEVLVLESKACIVDTVTYHADAAREGLGLPPGWAGFRTLAVHPRARNRDFGRRLVTHCIDMAHQEGTPVVGIHTAAFMTAACDIYERAGFQRCPEYDLWASDVFGFDPALGDEHVIAYRLLLSPHAALRQ